jgi:hypothetical protein
VFRKPLSVRHHLYDFCSEHKRSTRPDRVFHNQGSGLKCAHNYRRHGARSDPLSLSYVRSYDHKPLSGLSDLVLRPKPVTILATTTHRGLPYEVIVARAVRSRGGAGAGIVTCGRYSALRASINETLLIGCRVRVSRIVTSRCRRLEVSQFVLT